MNSAKWTVKWDPRALKDMKHFSSEVRERIFNYLESKIHQQANPRAHGKALTGNKIGLWRYRVGDYRIICRLTDGELVVLVVAVGHRKEVYH